MKNIHILIAKEGSPSRLHINAIGNLGLNPGFTPINDPLALYITSDEEIKDGDWCLDKFNQRWKLKDKKLIAFDSKGIKRFSTDNVLGHECKKIIITTDPTLIEDGVQAIDDEFLKWFVKNPTCEFVEVKSEWKLLGNDYEHNGYATLVYKIIIPQEEPKQESHICKYCDAETTQPDDECYAKPKQETLEEAAEKAFPTDPGVPIDSLNKLELIKYLNNAKKKEGFIAGAKWQAERMYSEEEVKDILIRSKYTNYDSIVEWFEQFEKK